jgi:hypothetical protein
MQLHHQRTAIGEGVAVAGVGVVTRGSDAALAAPDARARLTIY